MTSERKNIGETFTINNRNINNTCSFVKNILFCTVMKQKLWYLKKTFIGKQLLD